MYLPLAFTCDLVFYVSSVVRAGRKKSPWKIWNLWKLIEPLYPKLRVRHHLWYTCVLRERKWISNTINSSYSLIFRPWDVRYERKCRKGKVLPMYNLRKGSRCTRLTTDKTTWVNKLCDQFHSPVHKLSVFEFASPLKNTENKIDLHMYKHGSKVTWDKSTVIIRAV